MTLTFSQSDESWEVLSSIVAWSDLCFKRFALVLR